MQEFEKLGVFYLGRTHDLETKKATEELLLYDSKDLTTHAVCVGMTGSGKTGLCIGMLEEAAIDGIPAIAIDPKGDLGNLMLTFPNLSPAEFRPWIDPAEAERKGLDPEQYATKVAEKWRNGLAEWGQDAARVAKFRDAVDVAIYTPGSSAGLPLSVLRSLNAPPPAVINDPDALRERILATVSGLLALLGIKADPIRSREHILLSNILDRAWREGRSLEIGTLIREIQSPPFDTVGVMDIDTFYPAAKRGELAMTLNNLLASPAFAAWMEGEPLDIARLLYTPEGRPRIAILSIAHLGDAERMFFVTLLLNEVIAWMRSQSGTSSLRALLYMDEIFGYFPPTAAPPSKLPMLTLLKQARAYGLGVMLATQNPVDLDYKGLSNTGTWLIGRLQTERDKARVMEGLEGASSAAGKAFDKGKMEAILAGLGSRVFLMNNVHDDQPVIFNTRWVLSYLRGPLTRDQIGTLMATRKAAAPSAPQPALVAPVSAPAVEPVAAQTTAGRPVLPPEAAESFLAPNIAGSGFSYRPAILGAARLHFVNAKTKVDTWQTINLLGPLAEDSKEPEFDQASELAAEKPDLRKQPESGAQFEPVPSAASRPKNYTTWKKKFSNYLYQHRTLSISTCKAVKEVSKPGETEADFRLRVEQVLREKRDAEVEKLRKRYASKFTTLQDRLRRAQDKVEREKSQYGQQKLQTAISFGATVLAAFLGRKAVSASSVGRATTAMRGASRAMKEKGDIAAANETVEAVQQRMNELQQKFDADTTKLQESLDIGNLTFDTAEIRPRKSDISVGNLALVWVPWVSRPDGTQEPAY